MSATFDAGRPRADTGTWVSRAEVAEIDFTAFAAQKRANRAPGRLVVRRIPDFNDEKKTARQDTLFDTWRCHAFSPHCPGVLGTVARRRPTTGTPSPNRSTLT